MNIEINEFEKIIYKLNQNPTNDFYWKQLYKFDLKILTYFLDQLKNDWDFEKTEFFEKILKYVLKPFLANSLPGKEARNIAKFQQDLGFIMKYKSYAIKATTILGYSIFLQNEGEGFSFQRHLEHKTEIFQILNKKPNGFIFICDYESWEKNYSQDVFIKWLNGISNDFFDSHRYEPEPGDVIIIDKLGTVHTVIGCDLIEYATISTDMVERLYDQNKGKTIPPYFGREFAENKIKKLKIPTHNWLVNLESNNRRRDNFISKSIKGGQKIVLQNNFLEANMYLIDPKSESDLLIHSYYSKIIHILSGSGLAFIGEIEEFNHEYRISMQINPGDTLLVPKNIYSKYVNNHVSDLLIIAEQAISSEIALI